MILSVDPGYSSKDKGLGWASFDENGAFADYGQILPEDLSDLLKIIQPNTVVCENFRNRPAPMKRGAFTWKTNVESQVIGALRMYCEMANATFVLQEPANKTIGAKWSGVTVPNNHSVSHQVDAYSHGVYYIVKSGIRNAASYHVKEFQT